MEKELSVYLIDDNEVDRLICETLLEKIFGTIKIYSFSYADLALKDLANKIMYQREDFPDLILLDLDMPLKNGWDFLENYGRISNNIIAPKPQIYILTASINPMDSTEAKSHPLVRDILIKPFSVSAIEKIKIHLSMAEYVHS
jgi:CheY-like chemotaxis protein